MLRNITFDLARMHRHGSAFYEFLRLRKAFFVDQLHWDIPHNDDVEMDQYDNPSAWYSIVLDDDDVVVGGGRMMPTTATWGSHTYMLGDAVSGKLGAIPPSIMMGPLNTPEVWEGTRVVVADGLSAPERAECLSLIVSGMVDVAGRHGARELICLSRPTVVRALRQLGFPAERRGEPYVCADDGNTYALLAMPAVHAERRAPARVPARVPAGIHAGVHAGVPGRAPSPTHVPPATAPVHAPSIK